ncbi:MAG: ATP-binding protein [Ruminococcaceae bacterium]|nr:ATP-binding protein [Oscillospiraceae bacterium]
MTDTQKKNLACEISSISVFRGILNKKPIIALLDFLSSEGDKQIKMRLFGEFVYSLAEDNYSFSRFLCRAIYEDENNYIIGTARGSKLPTVLLENAAAELELFSRISRLNAGELCRSIEYSGYVPQFENEYVDFVSTYKERLDHIGRYGYGIFASAKMFRVADEGIVPVEAADDISIDSFVGYEEERRKVLENTRALVEGKTAANVLLFGDAGTGKSSTVKACANYFANDGVRLIEIRKDQLFSLSYVMGRIAENPLKFIIFIDDLSFNKNDDCFSMLKAALEGSASAKAKNAVIYATSNRRHIVKENFSDRGESDDVHHSDTVQELMSLSDRFGLTVYFERPNKSLYLDIIHALAEKNGVTMDKSELDLKAEAFALAKGSRSPRAAEQFIASLL